MHYQFIGDSEASYLGVRQSKVTLQVGFKEWIDAHQRLDNGHTGQMIHLL